MMPSSRNLDSTTIKTEDQEIPTYMQGESDGLMKQAYLGKRCGSNLLKNRELVQRLGRTQVNNMHLYTSGSFGKKLRNKSATNLKGFQSTQNQKRINSSLSQQSQKTGNKMKKQMKYGTQSQGYSRRSSAAIDRKEQALTYSVKHQKDMDTYKTSGKSATHVNSMSSTPRKQTQELLLSNAKKLMQQTQEQPVNVPVSTHQPGIRTHQKSTAGTPSNRRDSSKHRQINSTKEMSKVTQNTNIMIGPGSIISPQNREAISKAKSKQNIKEEASSPGGNTAGAPSPRILPEINILNKLPVDEKQVEKDEKQAQDIIMKYRGMIGGLYSNQSALSSVMPQKPSDLGGDKSRTAMAKYLKTEQDNPFLPKQNSRLGQSTGQADAPGKPPKSGSMKRRIQSREKQHSPLSSQNDTTLKSREHIISKLKAYSRQPLPEAKRSTMLSPQKQIGMLRKHTSDVLYKNVVRKQAIEDLDVDHARIFKNWKELKKKTGQAQLDKVELMRDLALYEANFGASSMISDRLGEIIEKVKESKEKVIKNFKIFGDEVRFTDSSYSEEVECQGESEEEESQSSLENLQEPPQFAVLRPS